MPIHAFENRRTATMTLTVQPGGERYDVPHLAVAGVRYTPKEGVEDRCYSIIGDDGGIEFWYDADSCDVDIVLPSAFNKLLWHLCVGGGWCGGLIDGEPTCVEDLLPTTGQVSAAEFARLVVRGDGWHEAEPVPEKHLEWIAAKFVEHLGAESVAAEELRRSVRQPFEDGAD